MYNHDVRSSNFVDDVLSGAALLSDIDNYIDDWHDGDSEQEIYDYLGLNIQEYGLFVENPAFLNIIIYAREFNLNLLDSLRDIPTHRIAARSLSEEKANVLLDWLKKRKSLE